MNKARFLVLVATITTLLAGLECIKRIRATTQSHISQIECILK